MLCRKQKHDRNEFAGRGLLTFVVVMGHLEASSSEAALEIEALVGLGAVEDGLVAADVLRDVVESLDHAQAELLTLLVLCNCDIFDVTNTAQAVNAVESDKVSEWAFT